MRLGRCLATARSSSVVKLPVLSGASSFYIVDSHISLTQRVREVTHRRQHQHDFLLVLLDVSVSFQHLHHQDRIQPWIDVGERSQVERELVAENKSQDGHDCANLTRGRGGTARQLLEQYFTFSQSRAHFLRHANGRPHMTHVLIGRSALRWVGAM
jgi:hypothetical protein